MKDIKLAKPISYFVVSYKGNVLILQRMIKTSGRKPGPHQQTNRELLLQLVKDVKNLNSDMKDVKSRLDNVEDILKRNNLK